MVWVRYGWSGFGMVRKSNVICIFDIIEHWRADRWDKEYVVLV